MAKAKKKDKDKEDDKPKEDKGKSKDKGKATVERARPRNDAYVMMLFITLVAIATGTFLVYTDHEEYGGKQAPKEAIPALPKLGDATKAVVPPPGGAGGGGPGAGDTPMGGME